MNTSHSRITSPDCSAAGLTLLAATTGVLFWATLRNHLPPLRVVVTQEPAALNQSPAAPCINADLLEVLMPEREGPAQGGWRCSGY